MKGVVLKKIRDQNGEGCSVAFEDRKPMKVKGKNHEKNKMRKGFVLEDPKSMEKKGKERK